MVRAAKMKRPSRAVSVGPTPYGRGVFARRSFGPRETIGEVGGTVVDDPRYGSEYCMDLDGRRALEPAAPFRYVNHSCRPNCRLVYTHAWDEADAVARHRLSLVSLAAVRPGEQLTIDYAWPAHMAVPCLCGSPGCRGWIVAPEELGEVAGRHDV